MVKSNPSVMPKSQKRPLDEETLRKLEEIEQRARERRLEMAELFARIRQRLRAMAAGR